MKNNTFINEINGLNIIFIILLLLILFYFLKVNKPLESFFPSIFRMDPYTLPLYSFHNRCTPENNCFPGTYARTQIYQNVCQPEYGLLKQKIPVQDNCQRQLLDYMNAPRHYYVCDVDKHLQRKCY